MIRDFTNSSNADKVMSSLREINAQLVNDNHELNEHNVKMEKCLVNIRDTLKSFDMLGVAITEDSMRVIAKQITTCLKEIGYNG